jgi:hypothetical protein
MSLNMQEQRVGRDYTNIQSQTKTNQQQYDTSSGPIGYEERERR